MLMLLTRFGILMHLRGAGPLRAHHKDPRGEVQICTCLACLCATLPHSLNSNSKFQLKLFANQANISGISKLELSLRDVLIEADKKLANIITTQVQRLDKVIENVLQLSKQQTHGTETIELNQWLAHFCEEFILSSDIQAFQLQLETRDKEVFVLQNRKFRTNRNNWKFGTDTKI